MDILLSIIIPVFNVEKYISKCLDSIINQEEIFQYEIILINDGSTDSSLSVCESYEERYPNIRVINQSNHGTGFSRNIGIEEAVGDYIYFCDPDDYLSSGFFESFSKYVDREYDLYIWSYWNEYTDKKNSVSNQLMCVEDFDYRSKEDFRSSFVDLYRSKTMYTLWNKVYKRSIIRENHIFFGFSSMGQDTRFNLKYYETVETCKGISDPFYHYIIFRSDSATNKYRKDRVLLKLEELNLLNDTLLKFEINPKFLSDFLKDQIFIDSCNYIINTDLSLRKKYEEIKGYYALNDFKGVFSRKHKEVNPITQYLLKNRHIYLYIFIVKMKSILT